MSARGGPTAIRGQGHAENLRDEIARILRRRFVTAVIQDGERWGVGIQEPDGPYAECFTVEEVQAFILARVQ